MGEGITGIRRVVGLGNRRQARHPGLHSHRAPGVRIELGRPTGRAVKQRHGCCVQLLAGSPVSRCIGIESLPQVGKCLLLDEREDVVVPTARLIRSRAAVWFGREGRSPAARRQCPTGVEVIDTSQGHLPQLIAAGGLAGALPGALHRRQEQPDQRGDDRDHHQEFHERKTRRSGLNARRERTIALLSRCHAAVSSVIRLGHERTPCPELSHIVRLQSVRIASGRMESPGGF